MSDAQELLGGFTPEDPLLRTQLELINKATEIRHMIGQYAVNYGDHSHVDFAYTGTGPVATQMVRGYAGERHLIEPARPDRSKRQVIETFFYWVNADRVANAVVSTMIFETLGEQDPPSRVESRTISVWPNGDFRWRFWDRRGLSDVLLTREGVPGVSAITVPVEVSEDGRIEERISLIQHYLSPFNPAQPDEHQQPRNNSLKNAMGLVARLDNLKDIMGQHRPSEDLYE